MNRVIITPQAEQEIRSIYRRIKSAAPAAAQRWSKGVRARDQDACQLSGARAPSPRERNFR
jgi:plasmid stabilization system protein ParE